MIAITFALPTESRDFLRQFGGNKHNVAVLHTGVGEKTCRARIARFVESRKLEFLISSGFAGGVDPGLRVGDLLLAENFSDPQLLARARDLLVSAVGELITAAVVIESEIDRQQFATENGAAAVDMETEFIAEACAALKIPMLSLRAISDTALAPFPAPPSVLFDLERQKTNTTALGQYLLRHPPALVRLVRFTRQVALARATLGKALVQLVDNLAF